jgi:hypothetical protein
VKLTKAVEKWALGLEGSRRIVCNAYCRRLDPPNRKLNLTGMRFAPLAVVLGGAMFALCRAALANENPYHAWHLWLMVLGTALLHVLYGFLFIGGATAHTLSDARAAAACAAASSIATAVTVIAAVCLARLLPLEVPAYFAASVAGCILVVGFSILIASGRNLRLRQILFSRGGSE